MKIVRTYCRIIEKDQVFQSEKNQVTLISLTS